MPYCERCNRDFRDWPAYDQHEANSPYHNLCHRCGEDFYSWTGLKEHWVQSPYHSYCQHCDRHFDNSDTLDDHYQSEHSYCRKCRQIFANDYGLKEHYRQSQQHHFCVSCNRDFQSASNLNAHLNSHIHRSKDVVCPTGCGGRFVSGSALALHLENGGCASGIDRRLVNQTIQRYDTNNLITDPARLLTSSNVNEEVSYIATGASWNGSSFVCYLCYHGYPTLRALNQHLASPKHQDKIYLCRGPSCGLRFNTLSGLFQHIESEKCGISKFQAVQNGMNSLLGQVGRITM